MANRREDVVEAALGVLDRWGLADLSVRRLAAELGVRPSALYHHFASKQLLLAAVAEEVLRRGPRRRPSAAAAGQEPWGDRARSACEQLRDAVLAVRDGAELVATVHAFGLGARRPREELRAVLAAAGCPPSLAEVGAGTLWHFVLGHATDEQTHLQAGGAGAIGVVTTGPGTAGPSGSAAEPTAGPGADFALGLELVLAGIATRLDAPATSTGPAGVGPAPVLSPGR